MPKRHQTDIRLDVDPGATRPAPRPIEERNFHVALLADFRGRRGPGSPGALQAVHVDRDEVDDVLARFAPTIRIGGAVAEGGVEVSFRELEDFHPDRLLERVPLFRAIREVAGGEAAGERPPPRRPAAPDAPVQDMLSGSVLDRIVDEQATPDEGGGGAGARDPLRRWVDQLVEPHLVEEPDAEQVRVEAHVEELLAEGMRAVLRDPAFRRLEALWRGVDFLVRRLDTGPRLTIHLVDATRAELASEEGLGAFRELLDRGRRGEPWSVVAALWDVGSSPEELVLLRGMARLAAASGTALVAGAEAGLAGLSELSRAGDRSAWGEPDRLWTALRGEPEASSVTLALPRFLLRLPYGKEGEPCDALELEEIPGTPTRDDYLWGDAALPVALILARAFDQAGPDLLGALDPEVRSLPLHIHQADGEPRATPCTEVALTHDDTDRFVDAGIMPFSWSRGSDAIRLVTLRSVASPPTRLAGPWRQ
ncbi:MAG: type VI secretion system contractile sheath large subunit [Gemmatimonadota bacterium]|jgi:type VI secretion system protein ImpC